MKNSKYSKSKLNNQEIYQIFSQTIIIQVNLKIWNLKNTSKKKIIMKWIKSIFIIILVIQEHISLVNQKVLIIFKISLMKKWVLYKKLACKVQHWPLVGQKAIPKSIMIKILNRINQVKDRVWDIIQEERMKMTKMNLLCKVLISWNINNRKVWSQPLSKIIKDVSQFL